MRRKQKGFTIIELMIVLTIIGVLAAISIPIYQEYSIRARLSNSATYVAPIKTEMAQLLQRTGGFNIGFVDNWSSLGIAAPAPINEVSAVSVGANNGYITITLNNIKPGTIDGTTVIMMPVVGPTSVTWQNTCSSTESMVKKFYNC